MLRTDVVMAWKNLYYIISDVQLETAKSNSSVLDGLQS